jgi:hypothetical protein
VDLPQVPVQRETVQGNRIEMVEHAPLLKLQDESRIDR